METPISVHDIIPKYSLNKEDNNNEEEEYDDDNEEDYSDKVDDLKYDLFNLIACDYHPLKYENNETFEEEIYNKATRATQLLINKLFQLPIEPSDVGPVAVLPNEVFKFPREKPCPEPKSETNWEKFAKIKGIKKTKKERMVYDDLTKQFVPRYGYKGANHGIEEHAVVEVKPGQDPNVDPWSVAREEKKERIAKNEQRRLRNIERHEIGKGRGKKSKVQSYDPSTVPGIPLEIVAGESKKQTLKGKRGKLGLRQALSLTQYSTASMGRFDEQREGEPEKKLKGKKRTFRDNSSTSTLSTEKSSMKQQLRIVEDKIHKKAAGITNSLKPYEGILPDAPSDTFKQKKGKGGYGGSGFEGPPKKKNKNK